MAEPAGARRRAVAPALLRFVLGGGFNTAATYALYLLVLNVLPYWQSYAIAFAAGIALAYLLNRFFVFGAPRREAKAAAMPLVYLAQYAAGAAIVYGWTVLLGLPAAAAPLASIAITFPATFFAVRWLFD